MLSRDPVLVKLDQLVRLPLELRVRTVRRRQEVSCDQSQDLQELRGMLRRLEEDEKILALPGVKSHETLF